ncbi:MAG: TetR/AcrR family transcriptional regulator [Patulibacter sp.]|nr:TetR/AcrR family transcriptional regulator [Patulibacter sp.]
MSTESRHAQRSNATRRKLIAAARELFAARGYADVGTTEIVRAAGVTRGALYHQFADKAELLAAVVDEIDAELTQQLASGAVASGAQDPVELLLASAEAFLRTVTRQEVHRVVLVDALPVLGWERWREIGLRHGLGLIEQLLRQGMDDGVLRRVPLRPLAHMLLAAIDEAALYVVAADDPDVARREMLEAITPLIDGLRA